MALPKGATLKSMSEAMSGEAATASAAAAPSSVGQAGPQAAVPVPVPAPAVLNYPPQQHSSYAHTDQTISRGMAGPVPGGPSNVVPTSYQGVPAAAAMVGARQVYAQPSGGTVAMHQARSQPMLYGRTSPGPTSVGAVHGGALGVLAAAAARPQQQMPPAPAPAPAPAAGAAAGDGATRVGDPWQYSAKLHAILYQIKPGIVLSDETQKTLLAMTDEFVTSVVQRSVQLAKHRGKVRPHACCLAQRRKCKERCLTRHLLMAVEFFRWRTPVLVGGLTKRSVSRSFWGGRGVPRTPYACVSTCMIATLKHLPHHKNSCCPNGCCCRVLPTAVALGGHSALPEQAVEHGPTRDGAGPAVPHRPGGGREHPAGTAGAKGFPTSQLPGGRRRRGGGSGGGRNGR
ncbi:unnamed protein product [Phaeothamnion confervicola]